MGTNSRNITFKIPTPFGSPLIGRTYQAGSPLKYRYGFNGKEKDNQIKGDGNSIAYEARIYDSRLGRFLSRDPLEFEYPWQSTYCFASNSPVCLIDYLGMGPKDSKGGDDPKVVKQDDSPKSFADRNHRTLDQIASANPNVFRNYPKNGTEEEKNNYWKTNEKQADGKPKFMIHPDQVLAIGPSVAESDKSSNPTENTFATKPKEPDKAGAPPSYTPPPKNLPGFPGAERVRQKGGRTRWKLPDGDIGEWDGRHGEVERYNPRGHHKGVWSPDGKQVKPAIPGRRIEPIIDTNIGWGSPSLDKRMIVVGATAVGLIIIYRCTPTPLRLAF